LEFEAKFYPGESCSFIIQKKKTTVYPMLYTPTL